MSTEIARGMAESLQQFAGENDLPLGMFVAVPWVGDADDILYRLVRKGAPAERDCLSKVAKGLPLDQGDPFLLHTGLSMFDDEGAARARAAPPTYIAEVRLPQDQGIYLAKTFGPHHFTVWGQPEILVHCINVIDKIGR